MKLAKVNFPVHHSFFTVDEDVSELDIRSAVPKFFSCPFGKRETYTIHRGAVICRHTVTYTGCKPERLTVTYLFGRWPEEKHSDVFCLSPYTPKLNSVAQAKRQVDRILDSGMCERV